MSVLDKIDVKELSVLIIQETSEGGCLDETGLSEELIRKARIGAEAEMKVKQCQRFKRFDCQDDYCRLYAVCKMVREGTE